MRISIDEGPLRLKAYAGTRVVLMVWDLAPSEREGLRGFAIRRMKPDGTPAPWLTGLKYFADLVPSPVKGAEYSSRKHPLQSFLWSDYRARPDTAYSFQLVALHGDLDKLEEGASIKFDIRTEPEIADGHGVWFNFGSIASHALASKWQNRKITKAMVNDVSDKGVLNDPEVAWLSRGLAEACLRFINTARPGEGLRVCAYEFTYKPILDALKRALDRGVDVRIVYHLTADNTHAVEASGFPTTADIDGKSETILFTRTKPKTPHNKFIVKLRGGKPREVWTGSTNFTDTGFFGQTNVGHLVVDDDTASDYLDYWSLVTEDKTLKPMVTATGKLAPNPPAVIARNSIAPFYSPRLTDNMLDWYGARMRDAANFVAITLPFNVADQILAGLDTAGSAVRLAILESPATPELIAAEKRNDGSLAYSNGAIVGVTFQHKLGPQGGAIVTPIPQSKVDQWFIKEELARDTDSGHVFFVHSKFVLIDPLSDDPLICSGSANFSKTSLVANDENMLLIRGSTRVADIYLTEFDRIFRHFYARDGINSVAKKKKKTDRNPLELDTGRTWIDSYFKAKTFKNARRLMFFPEAAKPPPPWTRKAAKDPDAFADEAERAKPKPKSKTAPAG